MTESRDLIKMTATEKIMRIMKLVLEINPPEIKGIGKKKTAVFVMYFPHIPIIELHIYRDGWTPYKSFESYDISPYREELSSFDEIIAILEEIKEREIDV